MFSAATLEASRFPLVLFITTKDKCCKGSDTSLLTDLRPLRTSIERSAMALNSLSVFSLFWVFRFSIAFIIIDWV